MSQQSVVPGVHRNKGVKMCPKRREDPSPLPQAGVGSREWSTVDGQSSVLHFFFLEELCKCFLPLLQFRSQKGALQPAKEALTALSLQDLRFGQQDSKLLSFLLFKHAKLGIPFILFAYLKKPRLGKPARHANASWKTASKHEFHVRTATVQQKPFPERQKYTLVIFKSTTTFRLCFPAWVCITCLSGGCCAKWWISHAPLVRNSSWYLGKASVPCQPASERSKPGGRCLFRSIPGVSSWLALSLSSLGTRGNT